MSAAKAVMTVEQVAELAHEANRAYCRTLGDTSQPPWIDAPEWQRASAVSGVRWRLKHADAAVDAQHEAWLDQKRVEGWCYGPVKDAAKKEHPCFVRYDELPPEQRLKDALFIAVVECFRAVVVR